MDQLRVIEGEKVDKPDYVEIYLGAFMNAVNELKKQDEETRSLSKDTYKKAIFYGVRYISISKNDSLNYDYLMNRFLLISYLENLMKVLTPRDFMTIFPIDKNYDGARYEMKDYFFTMNEIKKIGMDTPIGEKIMEFLWDYQNFKDITLFNLASVSILNKLQKMQGKKTLTEEFAERLGIDTYTKHKEKGGKEYITNDRTGEIQEVKKSRPRYLKPVQ
ncbi:conserved phage protein [Bacillus phage Gamma isolate d'Herelle]|uniref:Conserved phage protein n=3 Tax=Wbetavirus TaxID=1623308 RepID=Q2LIF2_9CAUD|nr:hypothetical protein [Bacillus anthracis]YP_010739527.1 conserved phage protein [Bacillus phage Gamma]YP_338161.1 conserved phage protein [Bacillus phage Cherry]YP_338214.1 conserved phage protein [Bacillus phage Gamma]YP_459997.1 conserved phage protein [Bacillus phage WBeta]YP_512342.1 hypothetical protein Fah30 [Bacillus phage Fah]ABC40484.1 conserved phage protein [Bacillus phage Gamma isolate d'Herelle]EDX57855.1 conserved phage protein [Bacillus cereus W]ABA42724.1 hypothetical pro